MLMCACLQDQAATLKKINLWTPDLVERVQMPLRLLCMVCQFGENVWMAIAPELIIAVGTGADAEDAMGELQEKLVHLKEWILADKHTSMARSLPLNPTLESAVEQVKEDPNYCEVIFRRGAKRVLWRMVTGKVHQARHRGNQGTLTQSPGHSR